MYLESDSEGRHIQVQFSEIYLKKIKNSIKICEQDQQDALTRYD
jgi:hypothetical protein